MLIINNELELYYLHMKYLQGRREVRGGGALRQNIFKITAFEKIVANLI